MSRKVSVIASLQRGRKGWLVRWVVRRSGSNVYGTHHDYWTASRDEADAVAKHISSGLTLDEALRRVQEEQ